MSASDTKHRSVIEAIARVRGIGLELDRSSDASQAIEWSHRTLGNALKMLSDQLYNSETHFLLELLQNADDNEYGAGVVPTVEVAIKSDAIIVLNNEIGFSAENVNALCGVGESTKRERKEFSIGEKGIGFKSVFKVSDRPEIHSRGFHFRFDRQKHGDLGLVTPEWIEGGEAFGDTGTTIVLPLKQDISVGRSLLEQCRPELLLFLRKVRELRLNDSVARQSMSLGRSDSGPIVTISRRSEASRESIAPQGVFFVFRRSVPMAGVKDDLRPDIVSTDVVVALALNADHSVDASRKRDLFAFLPVRESGLTAVVHADFVLTTSRGDVLRERPWNVRLRDALAEAFVSAVAESKAHGAVGRTAIRALSRPDSVPDPFVRTIMANAIKLLKEQECIPVAEGRWRRPNEALRADGAGLSNLFTPADVEAALGKSLVDESIADLAGPLDLLGVPTFQLNDLLAMCSDAAWLETKSSAWLASLYAALGRLPDGTETTDRLKRLPILRLSSGNFASATVGVFRSLDRKVTYGFEGSLALLDPAILAAAKSSGAADDVNKCLTRLSVRDASPKEVIDHYIAPIHRDERWMDLGFATLAAHLRYVRDHIEAYLPSKGDERAHALELLRSSLQVRSTDTADGSEWYSNARDLYLGDAYGDPNSLEALFEGEIETQLVSPAYLESDGVAKGSRSSAWAGLFRQLGARVLPHIERTQSMPSRVRMPAPVRGQAPPPPNDFVPSEEFRSLLATDDPERVGMAIRLVDAHWDAHYAQFAKGDAGPAYARIGFDSTFLVSLREARVRDHKGAVRSLGGMYLRTEDNVAVFGEDVPYVSEKFSVSFADAIGIVVRPSVEQALRRLSDLSRGNSYKTKGVMRLYQFLSQYFEQHADVIRDAFALQPLIAVGSPKDPEWATSGQCCWDVPSRLREPAPVYGVHRAWESLQEFFVEQIGIREVMTAEQWVETLAGLQDLELDNSEVGELARQVYRQFDDLLDGADRDDDDPAEWLGELITKDWVWCNKDEWWRNDNDIVGNDDPDLADLFRGSERTAFIDIDPADLPRFARLLEHTGVPRLSGVVEVSHRGRGAQSPDAGLNSLLQRRWRYIVRLMFHQHQREYRDAVEADKIAAECPLVVSVWEPLVLDVSLRGELQQKQFEARLIECDGEAELLVDAGEVANWSGLSVEIGRWLGISPTASMSIAQVLGQTTEGDVEKTLRTLRVHDLPEDEWSALAGIEAGDDSDKSAGEENADEPDDQSPVAATNEGGSGVTPSDSSQPGAIERTPGAEPKRSGDSTTASSGGPSPSADEALSRNRGKSGGSTTTEGGAKGAGRTRRAGARVGPQPERGPPIQPDAPKSGGRRQQRRAGRLISYVEPGESGSDDESTDDLASPERQRLGRLAAEFALERERKEGREAKMMPHTNKGYDIESGVAGGAVERYIEVKGLRGEWGERGVTLTAAQFEFAQKQGDRAWLYVVEYADDPSRRRLHRVRNPARQVAQFGFDHGWRGLAETFVPQSRSDAEIKVGASWRSDDGTLGTIVSVKPFGSFLQVEVQHADGSKTIRTGTSELLRRFLVLED